VTTSLSVPKTCEDIAPDWMSAALSAHHPGAEVSGVSVDTRDDGTNR
jgi:hypothetical protein